MSLRSCAIGTAGIRGSHGIGRRRPWPVRAASQAGLAYWISLIIVLVLGTAAAIAAGYYLVNRSYTRNVEEIQTHVSNALAASAQDVLKALNELKAARQVLDRFESTDPKQLELQRDIKRAEDKVREACKKELGRFIEKGDLIGAQDFYEHQAKAIDSAGDLKEMLEDSTRVRELLDELRTGLRTARQNHDGGKLEAALDLVTDLQTRAMRTKLASPGIAALREEINGLKQTWVGEARQKAMAAFNEGHLDEAREWFDRLAKRYVVDEQELRRRFEGMVTRIRQGDVVGVVVNVGEVQIPDAKQLKQKLFEQLKELLENRSFLAIELSGPQDSKGAQLRTFLVADYSEEKGKPFVSPDKSMRALGTKISCVLKIQKQGSRAAVWLKRLQTETPTELAFEGRKFGSEFLRESAVAIFDTILKSADIPIDKLKQ